MSIQFTLAGRYLRGRGVRSLMTTLAVVFAVMLIFGLNGLIPTMMEAFTRNMLSAAGKIDLSVVSAFQQPFSLDIVDKVAAVHGVKAVTPEVQRIAPLPRDADTPDDALAQLNVIGVDPASVGKVRDFPLAAGRALAPGDSDLAVLSSDLATQLGLTLGDDLTLPSSVGTARFRVVGLVSTPTIPGQEQVFVPLASAQRLFGLGSRITVVEAVLADGIDRAATERAVAKAVGNDYVVGGLSTNTSLIASMGVAVFAFNMFGIFALATAGFIILNSFRTVVAERRRDIGMLRAIGARRGTITGMFLIESLFQGAIGTALGIVAGYGMAVGFFALLSPTFESIMHMKIGAPIFTLTTWLEAIVLGIGVTVAAAILPARAAGRVTPMDAMRPQLGEVYERRVGHRAWIGLALIVASVFGLATGIANLVGFGAVVFLIGTALVAPAVVTPIADWFARPLELIFAREGAIARSNLQRNPGRSGITVTAVMLGLAAIVAMLSVVTSIFTGFASYIDKSLSADYMLIPQSIILSQGNVAAAPRLTEAVRATQGIGPVSALRITQGRVDGGDVQVIGIDPQTYPQVSAFEWNAGSSDLSLAQLGHGRWVIANGIYASQHGLELGQAITLDTPNGRRVYHVAGIGNDSLIMANRLPNADPQAVKARLDRLVKDYPAFRLFESAQWREEQMTTFSQTIFVFYVLVAALALPSLLALVNTLAISVLARTREIGMLRAVGSTRRQIRRMVMAESLLLSFIGTAFGVIAGLWLGYALVVAMGSIGWQMPYEFPWGGVAATFIVGVTFGVLAAIGPARSAARLDVVQALRHE